MTPSDTVKGKKFSVVIPVFNVADYIGEALDSAIDQDIPHDQYEIIVVDDHSTDRTEAVIGEYIAKYPGLFRLLSNPGEGVSHARNFGVDHAQGKYILFLDADDLLESSVLERIYNTMEDGRLDMLAMTYSMVNGCSGKYKTRNILRIETNDEEIITGRDFLIRRLYRGVVWMYAYRREFLINSGVRMLQMRHEDENFIPRILARAQRVRYAPIELYVYRMRDDSYMNMYRPENLFDVLNAIANMRDDIVTSFPHDSLLCETIEERASCYTLMSVKRAVRDGFGNEREVIEEARSKSLIPLRNRGCNYKRFLVNRFPATFIAIYRLIAKKRTAMR